MTLEYTRTVDDNGRQNFKFTVHDVISTDPKWKRANVCIVREYKMMWYITNVPRLSGSVR